MTGTPGGTESRPRIRCAAAVVTAACLLLSCSAEQTVDADPDRDRTSTISPTPGTTAQESPSAAAPPDDDSTDLPAVPGKVDAATRAGQLQLAARILRSEDATRRDQRRAAEFHQLAVRHLATATAAYRRKVTTLLPAGTARAVRSDVGAARLLSSLTDPQSDFPRWRIVAPLPQAELIGYYKRAQRRTRVPWFYLAAIHLVETRMGRIRGTSSAGAKGPMQFLPTTWDLYGAGGDINDPRDAILAAARLLRHHGAPGDMAEALWHYNPSDSYVGAVREYAGVMQRSPRAYAGYWHWRVLYRHARGTYVLPVGYPKQRPVLLSASAGR